MSGNTVRVWVAGLVLGAHLVVSVRAAGETRTWDRGGDRVSWSDRLNWSGDRVPLGSDDAIIAAAFQNFPKVQLDAFNIAVRSLQIAGSGLTTNQFALTAVGGGVDVQSALGSLGRIDASDSDPARHFTDPQHFASIYTDSLRLRNLSDIVLHGSVVDITHYYVQADIGSAIRGSGRFDLGRTDGNPGFLSHGLIRPTGGPIIVQHEPAAAGANAVAQLAGTIDLTQGSLLLDVPLWKKEVRAEILLGGGQTLRIADAWTLEPNATFGAFIHSAPGTLNTATISSGTLTVTGATRLTIGAGTTILEAPLNLQSGSLEIRDDGALLVGTITNNALIRGTGLLAPAHLVNNNTIASTGLLLIDSSSNSIDLDGASGTGYVSAHDGNIVIADALAGPFRGGISIGNERGVRFEQPWTLDAAGTIQFGAGITAGLIEGAKATLAGHISAGNTAHSNTFLYCPSEFAPSAFVELGGVLWLTDDSIIRQGARFEGAGTLHLARHNVPLVTHRFDDGADIATSVRLIDARLEVGEPIGKVTIGGHFAAFTFSNPAGPTLAIDLAGATPGTGHDRIDVAASATLAGTLELRLRDGFVPSIGDAFDILTAASIDGRFDRVNGVQVSPDVSLAVLTEPQRVRVVAAIPGDANLDQAVNLQDFNRLAAEFGSAAATWIEADFTGDGRVTLMDFNTLAAHFGITASGPEITPYDWANLAAAVPEPHLGAAVVAGAIGLSNRRRQRRAR